VGREPFIISNPRENNRVLVIEATGQSGQKLSLARLQPGESYRVEKERVTLRAVKRPSSLEATLQSDGTYAVPSAA
jgi:hypothetical protein